MSIDDDLKKVLEELNTSLRHAEQLQVWAKLAKIGCGYVKCEELGIYIVTEEFFNQNFMKGK